MDSKEAQHRLQASSRLSSLGKRLFNLIEFDESEELVLEIRKHPFGLLLVQVTGLLITLIIVGGAMLLAFNIDSVIGETIESGGARSILTAAGLILGALSIIGTEIVAMLYQSNVIFVTTEKIAQVVNVSIFNRKLSQLSIGDIQDVSASQAGIFPRLLNYGTLVIETAGEQQNYTFTYVPRPYDAAKAIVGAHEENLKKYGN